MAGQSDAPDDLIAELAKLMAQDAQGSRPAEPAAPTFTVRIPGGDTPPDSARRDVPAAPVAPAPVAPPVSAPVAAPVARAPDFVPLQPARPAQKEEPEPFRFDFDLNSARRSPVEPTFAAPTPAPVAPAPIQAAAPSSAPAPAPAAVEEEHDSIADLIAAELAGTSSAEPELVQAADDFYAATEETIVDVPEPEEPIVARPSEQDRFSVPPVFGLGTRSAPSRAAVEPSFAVPVTPTPAAPPVQRDIASVESYPVFQSAAPVEPVAGSELGLDPIDEIENLIGRAVNVDMDRPAEDRPVASPALRSLATPTLPAEPPEAPRRRAMTSADETVFAAAQASGAQVGWVDSPEIDEAEPAPRTRQVRERTPRSFHMSRAVAGPLVAVGLLVVAGLGLYWVLGLNRETGPAPLLTADASPIKSTPEVDATDAAPQQSVVFNEIDGVVPGAEEQLVSRDQADLNEVTQVPAADLSEEGLANRKVRTVTVRPDGTIVSGDESVAGSTILPVDRPNVPAVPGAETASPELLANAGTPTTTPTPTPTTPAAETPAATPAPATPVTAPVAAGATVPAVDASGTVIPGKTTTIPLVRPSSFAQQPSAATSVTAIINDTAASNTLPPAPAASALAPAPSVNAPVAQPTEVDALPNNAPAYVQLASQRSEAEARQTAASLVTRFGPLFGGANMEVQRVDLGAKGIYYRVRVPANSLQDANSMCNNVKAAGGDCFTM